MKYQHTFTDGTIFQSPLGKLVCAGRNYADHARELNNPVPTEPVLFMKPATAVVPLSEPFSLPADQGECHFETELAVLVGETLCQASAIEARRAIAGVGIGLDLTLRDVQQALKSKGLPWEKAKAFDGSCPLSAFLTPERINDIQNIQIRMTRNGEIKQDGNTEQMLTGVIDLLVYISNCFTLEPGDVVMTGTPAGVGPLTSGDQLKAELVGLLAVDCTVI